MRDRDDGLKTRERVLVAIAVVSIIFAAVAILNSGDQKILSEIEMASIEDLSTNGFVVVKPMADVVDGEGLIALTGGCYRMVAGTDPGQAESIRDALDGITRERPNTHDVMRDAFDSLGIEVVMAKVTNIQGNNFLGRIILQQGDTLLNLDSRPSDGIALAIRTNSTIYFNETLLEERGRNIC